MPLNIQKVFVISLEFREDRLANFYRQYNALNQNLLPEAELWPAIKGDTCCPPEFWHAGNGAWGCYKSHVNILEYCLNNNIGSYLVFEDDAQFSVSFAGQYPLVASSVPEDWQQLYLGGQLIHEHNHPPLKINSYIYRPYNVNRTHAFAVSRPGMLPIYQHISNLPFNDREHIDHHLGRWHEDQRNKVYCSSKWLVGQMGYTSNVSGRKEEIQFYTDPDSLALSHRLYDDPVCILFRGSPALLRQAKKYLHIGNSVDANGFDITISQAIKYKDPVPTIQHWFNWIRSEIAYGNTGQLPCVNHPALSKELLEQCDIGRIIEIFPKTLEDIQTILKNHV